MRVKPDGVCVFTCRGLTYGNKLLSVNDLPAPYRTSGRVSIVGRIIPNIFLGYRPYLGHIHDSRMIILHFICHKNHALATILHKRQNISWFMTNN
jgi:hypothetical protein